MIGRIRYPDEPSVRQRQRCSKADLTTGNADLEVVIRHRMRRNSNKFVGIDRVERHEYITVKLDEKATVNGNYSCSASCIP